MKEELRVINEQEVLGKNFKVYGSIDSPLFLAKDVAEWIDYDRSKSARLTDSLEDEEKVRHNVSTLGGIQEQMLVTEDGLYEILMQSRKPIAKSFKKEVKKILKQLRLTGGVVVQDKEEEFINNYFTSFSEDVKLAMVHDLRVQNARFKETIAQQSQQMLEYEPKVTYYDMVLSSENAENITVIAKDYGMSATAFNKMLHTIKVQFKQGETWLLYQNYADKGYTKSKTSVINKPNGETITKMNTKWTQKGRLFLYDILKKNGVLPMIERENFVA